jgi:hypothetical protein
MLFAVFRHIFKYLIFGIIIYLLIAYIPKEKMTKNLESRVNEN